MDAKQALAGSRAVETGIKFCPGIKGDKIFEIKFEMESDVGNQYI